MAWWKGLRSAPRRGVIAVAAAVMVAAVAIVATGASAHPTLPATTPTALIASTLRAMAADRPVSGELVSKVDLGLPSLPDEGPQAEDSLGRLFSAISGDHRVRLWSSVDGLRVAELLPGAELSLTVSRGADRTDVWAWDSHSFTAYHAGPLPGTRAFDQRRSMWDVVNPETLAEQALQAIDPSTAVAVSGTARVAGRDAYELSLTPRSTATLVGRIAIAIDASTRRALRVEVFPRGASSPAVSVGFRSVSFDPIDPSTYRFTPPPGAAVRSLPSFMGGHDDGSGAPSAHEAGEYMKVFGTGWATVVAYRLPASQDLGAAQPKLGALLPFSGPLFSLSMADRGDHTWLLVGAVPPSRLTAVQGSLP